MDSDSDQSDSGDGPANVRSPIHVGLILPDPCLSHALDDGHAIIEAVVLDVKRRSFSLRIHWVKSTYSQGREVKKECVLSTTDALRRDLDSLWVFTTDEEMSRVVRDIEWLLVKQGLEVPS